MKCFFHSADLDGHCSGAIIKDKYPMCEMIGINYGQEFPFDTIERGETVFMVDFCIQPFSDMERLNGICNLFWFDHHKTAIEKANSRAFSAYEQVIRVGDAACEITAMEMMKKLPYFVYLLGRYDVWQHENPDVMKLQYGLRTVQTDPSISMSIWEDLLHPVKGANTLGRFIDKGEAILEYVNQSNQKVAETCSFKVLLHGRIFIAMNKPMSNSQVMDAVYDPALHDGMMFFSYYNKKWNFSLFSTKDDVDVSTIALKYGGGGHRGAAGFQVDQLPIAIHSAIFGG